MKDNSIIIVTHLFSCFQLIPGNHSSLQTWPFYYKETVVYPIRIDYIVVQCIMIIVKAKLSHHHSINSDSKRFLLIYMYNIIATIYIYS